MIQKAAYWVVGWWGGKFLLKSYSTRSDLGKLSPVEGVEKPVQCV